MPQEFFYFLVGNKFTRRIINISCYSYICLQNCSYFLWQDNTEPKVFKPIMVIWRTYQVKHPQIQSQQVKAALAKPDVHLLYELIAA